MKIGHVCRFSWGIIWNSEIWFLLNSVNNSDSGLGIQTVYLTKFSKKKFSDSPESESLFTLTIQIASASHTAWSPKLCKMVIEKNNGRIIFLAGLYITPFDRPVKSQHEQSINNWSRSKRIPRIPRGKTVCLDFNLLY